MNFIKKLLTIVISFGLVMSIVSQPVLAATPQYQNKNLNSNVIKYKPLVEKYTKKYSISKYTNVLLAIMMVESHGKGNNVMQVSSSKKIKIKPEESINRGVKIFKDCLSKSRGDLKTAIQSYNYGTGFASYVKSNGGKYTPALALAFQKKMKQKYGYRVFGNAKFVSLVQKYVTI